MQAAASSGQSAEPKPWEVEPVLRARRLDLLARVAVETRNRAFAEANRDEGDTNWGLGCKAHERFCHALRKLADGAESPWLRVEREGLSFTTLVEHVPIRVYRGSVLKPPMRHVRTMALEKRLIDDRQLSLFGEAAVETTAWFWMMAVETFDDGRVKRTVFFQVDEAGNTRHLWEPDFTSHPPGLFGDEDDAQRAPVRKKRARASLEKERQPTIQ